MDPEEEEKGDSHCRRRASALQVRVEALERRLGEGGHGGGGQPLLVDRLAALGAKVDSLHSGQPRLAQVHRLLQEHQGALLPLQPPAEGKDSTTVEEEDLGSALAQAERDLDQWRQLRQAATTATTATTSGQDEEAAATGRLEALRLRTLHQLQESRALKERTLDLMGTFGHLTDTLKAFLVTWDTRLKQGHAPSDQ
ncbi:hypothetical protein HDE_12626 [Halotydeus destructor]|nr:hypothetical protein HDE_12626 [Halotydeus destructor]